LNQKPPVVAGGFLWLQLMQKSHRLSGGTAYKNMKANKDIEPAGHY
jgi:hypothetical protein